jgi:choline dehydrogenase-like flavoprotein
LKYFKKSENFQNETINTKYHSKEGLIGVRYPAHVGETVHRFVKAGEELGFPRNEDYNGEFQEGFSVSQQTISENGFRSTSTQYIKKYLNSRPNLHLTTMSHVTKILIRDKVAIGVELKRFKEDLRVYAKKEVILSAGSIASPQLLMLSGIGPKKHLEEMGIEVVVDSPNVGQNLQDHPILSVEFNTTYYGLRQDDLESVHYILDFLINRNNYLSGAPVLGTAFFNSSLNDLPFPDLQIHFLPATNPCRSFKSLFGWKDGHCLTETKDSLGFLIVLLHEKSKGFVKLKSKNPLDHPLIDLNFFKHPDDKKRILEGVRIVQKLVASKHFDGFRGDLKRAPMNPEKFDTDEYWNWSIENYGSHLFHAAGTCKMGVEKEAVVDPRLRVNGVKNLRVVDASIMPVITSGNTMAPVYMIAEKAADMIKEDNKN